MSIDHQQPRTGEGPKNRRGPRLGSGAPIGCVPVTRPRRDRVMGSSILASLSEAGGNDPHGLVSKPLPPHSLDPADRVERNPRPLVLQTKGPNRAVLPGLHYVESAVVSGPDKRLITRATCRSGNRRPTAESAPVGRHRWFQVTPINIFTALSQQMPDRFRREQCSAPRILPGAAPTRIRLLHRSALAAWRLQECGS